MKQLALIYAGLSLPILQFHAEEPLALVDTFLELLAPYLPQKFYAHMGERAASLLASDYSVEPRGNYLKMALQDPAKLVGIDASAVTPLAPADADELRALYQKSYAGNWFDPYMLETGFYFGIRKDNTLTSAAGVHVCSKSYKVAALGNVATLPQWRGQGFATSACARLCQELLKTGVTHVGLNVKEGNASAIGCYQRLGFSPIATYGEYMCELK